MNVFQYLVGALMLALTVFTLRASLRGGIRKRIAVFWSLLWIGAGVAAVWPRTTVIVARALGIGRGADLILYCSVFAMLIGFFYVYTRFRKLDRAFTLLVREIAIERPMMPESRALPLASTPTDGQA
jgi:hypothetical protein